MKPVVAQLLRHYDSALKELYAKPSCKWVKLARDRFYKDLETGHERGIYFDPEAAYHAINFFSFLNHSKGQWAGQQFVLSPWQEFDIMWNLFGWKRDDGARRFREAYIEVAKKNGKSTMMAGAGLYLTVGDREAGAEVYSVATKREQARIVHSEAIRMAKSSQRLSGYISVLKNNISMLSLGSKYEPLSADADTQDGLNVHGALADELHRWKERDLLDVIRQSAAARLQPMIIAITTAGSNRHSVCWEMRRHATNVLEGITNDDTFFSYICTLDEKDDPFDETNWIKANPNLGVTIRLDEMQSKAERAKNSMAELNAFLRFRLNIWTEQDVRWLDVTKWDECKADFSLSDFHGCEVVGGLDLSTTLDISAFVVAMETPDSKIKLLPFFFVPEDNMATRWARDKVPYPEWAQQGYIFPTPGNVVDYDYVRDKILKELATVFTIREIAYDPWNATQAAGQLQKGGIKMVEFRQGFHSMNAASKMFEKMILSQRVQHNGNPVLKWMVRNVAVRVDGEGNIKPDKSKSAEKIDGVVASIMAVARLGADEQEQASVYTSRGILTL